MVIKKSDLLKLQERDRQLEKNSIACRDLLCQKMGIDYDKKTGDMYLVDEDTNSYTLIRFEGKNAKYPIPGRYILEDSEILFDPYNNIRLIASMLNMYIETFMPGMDALSVSLASTKINQYGNAKIQFMNGEIYYSNKYYRDSLKYLDLIFMLDGSIPPEFAQIRGLDINDDIVDKRTMEAYRRSKEVLQK